MKSVILFRETGCSLRHPATASLACQKGSCFFGSMLSDVIALHYIGIATGRADCLRSAIDRWLNRDAAYFLSASPTMHIDDRIDPRRHVPSSMVRRLASRWWQILSIWILLSALAAYLI